MRLSLLGIIGAVLSAMICQVSTEKAYIFNTACKANWFKANVLCDTYNMRLVSIHSLEENNLIQSKAEELGLKEFSWWTAGNDLTRNRQFYWGFTERMIYTNWRVGEPNNAGGNEDCVQIIHSEGKFVWNDNQCSVELFCICEYNTNSQLVGANNLTLDEV